MSHNFDLHCRYALLTYAQSDGLDPWEIVGMLGEIPAECIVGREEHADEGIHYHVFVDFGRKRRFRRANQFDVGGFHPNIVPSRGTPWDGFDYATKDGDVVAGGLQRPDRDEQLPKDSDRWNTIVAAESREQFWDLVRIHAPKSLCVSFPSLAKYADWRFQPRVQQYETPDGTFTPPGELGDWLSQSGIGSTEQSTRRKFS